MILRKNVRNSVTVFQITKVLYIGINWHHQWLSMIFLKSSQNLFVPVVTKKEKQVFDEGARHFFTPHWAPGIPQSFNSQEADARQPTFKLSGNWLIKESRKLKASHGMPCFPGVSITAQQASQGAQNKNVCLLSLHDCPPNQQCHLDNPKYHASRLTLYVSFSHHMVDCNMNIMSPVHKYLLKRERQHKC